LSQNIYFTLGRFNGPLVSINDDKRYEERENSEKSNFLSSRDCFLVSFFDNLEHCTETQPYVLQQWLTANINCFHFLQIHLEVKHP
jgi:hypothetical protein